MRWIVGDIHGMFRPLSPLLEAVRLTDSDARFYFAGDYVNRGPDSQPVIDLLLSLPAGSARFVRGNHDDVLDLILNGSCYAPNAAAGDRLTAFTWFMEYGLGNTLCSYGADLGELLYLAEHPSPARLEALLRCVPKSHRKFIRETEPLIEEEDLFVGHGVWPVNDPDSHMAQRLADEPDLRHILLWSRFRPGDLPQIKSWRRTGYFGHSPVDIYPQYGRDGQPLPLRLPKMVLLDTAAALVPQGRLTAWCHETGTYIQVSRLGEVVACETPDRG